MRLNLESMAISLPCVARHPNRLAFHGVLTLLDVASDKAPAGARGHRVLLTREAAERALPSLLGMALDFTPTLDGHDARRKVGVITRAEITPANPDGAPCLPSVGRRGPLPPDGARQLCQLEIGGYLYARDFPDVVEKIRGGAELGMSYEIAEARVADPAAAVWVLTDVTFTGAAMLLRSKAAYGRTWISLESGTAEATA